MATKGTESKNIIFNKLQEFYPNAFWEDQGKILRIPLDENGSRVEIKVTLTAAKVNLGDNIVNSAFDNNSTLQNNSTINSTVLEPTQEEKENVRMLIESLGL